MGEHDRPHRRVGERGLRRVQGQRAGDHDQGRVLGQPLRAAPGPAWPAEPYRVVALVAQGAGAHQQAVAEHPQQAEHPLVRLAGEPGGVAVHGDRAVDAGHEVHPQVGADGPAVEGGQFRVVQRRRRRGRPQPGDRASGAHSPAGPVAGGVGSGVRCWQSHHFRPGQSSCRRSRQARQIMPAAYAGEGRDSAWPGRSSNRPSRWTKGRRRQPGRACRRPSGGGSTHGGNDMGTLP